MQDETKKAIVALGIIAGATVAAIMFHRAAILWIYALAVMVAAD